MRTRPLPYYFAGFSNSFGLKSGNISVYERKGMGSTTHRLFMWPHNVCRYRNQYTLTSLISHMWQPKCT